MVICSVDCDIADYATVKVSSLRILSGHDQAVTSLSWSPHNISMLLSASMDGTAQVWDLSEEKPELANFRGHVGRIHAAAWCPTDDSLIATGGTDQSVYLWNYHQQPFTTPPQGMRS